MSKGSYDATETSESSEIYYSCSGVGFHVAECDGNCGFRQFGITRNIETYFRDYNNKPIPVRHLPKVFNIKQALKCGKYPHISTFIDECIDEHKEDDLYFNQIVMVNESLIKKIE